MKRQERAPVPADTDVERVMYLVTFTPEVSDDL